jgi:hypothetical protein
MPEYSDEDRIIYLAAVMWRQHCIRGGLVGAEQKFSKEPSCIPVMRKFFDEKKKDVPTFVNEILEDAALYLAAIERVTKEPTR